MIIERILNNNAIMSLDETGAEIIVKGKGLAFKRKVGEPVDDSLVEKVFVIANAETNRHYQEILVSIPDDCIDACEKMIAVIKERIDKDLSDKIYVTLTDHIHNLLERTSMGITFDNSLLWDVKRLYQDEYDAGLEVVKMIRKYFNVKIPDDEASFIALHIVNAQLNTEFNEVVKITTMIDDVYDIIESSFGLQFDTESLDYSRFIMHLRVFFERIYRKENYSSHKDHNLLGILKNEYPDQYACVMNILEYVKMRTEQPLDGEILYLLIHVIKLTSR